jgi:hypothetical protein
VARAVAEEGAAEEAEAANPKPNLFPRPFFGISFSSHVLCYVELTQSFFRTLNRNVLVLIQPNISSNNITSKLEEL